jgi:putative transcriptional regulator
MGMNTILMLIMGIAMTAIIGSQVAPSMIEQIKATKVEAKSINNQEVIFEAVKRYITMKQTNPTSLQDIIGEQFLNAKVNDNGFGGGYSIEIDGSKGLLKIKTTIEDSKAQEIFLNSFKNKFIPTRVGTTNEFETTFVIPTDIMHGRGLFMTGIPVQATPPTDTSLKYWYDTSGKEVALRMYDPKSETWKKVAGTGGSGSISESALVDASGDNFTKDTLPTTNAEVGEIKYAYDSTTNSIQEYIYTGNTQGWVVKGGGGSPQSYPKSCLEYKEYGESIWPHINGSLSGVYTIDPDGKYGIDPFNIYCDMTTDSNVFFVDLETSYNNLLAFYRFENNLLDYKNKYNESVTEKSVFIMTEKELKVFEATRDIEAEILQGIDDMLANNAAKRTVITETDVALARRKAQLTQDQFAKILGVSRRTLESWEQGARRPSGAATSLIRLFIVDPKFVKESLA